MPYITVGQEHDTPIELHYQDLGAGRPVVLIHGWPLSGRSWEKQVRILIDGGYRVITYDRRGFGKSSQPVEGYDYDTLADDLRTLLGKLQLKDVTLVGFSMGGGEVARYLGKYGSAAVRQAVFISAITPALLKASDNPDGVDAHVFEGIVKALRSDRPAFLGEFFNNFYNVDVNLGKRISDEAVQLSWNTASEASPIATSDCVKAWGTDFRKDLENFKIPSLIIHGDADRTVPFEASGKRMAEFVKGSKLVIVKGGPHGLNWTHAEELNKELLNFLGQK